MTMSKMSRSYGSSFFNFMKKVQTGFNNDYINDIYYFALLPEVNKDFSFSVAYPTLAVRTLEVALLFKMR